MFPEALEYLWHDVQWLRAGAGEGMSGLAPLTWSTVKDWMETTGVNRSPRDIEALFQLDGAMRTELRTAKPAASPRKGPRG